MGASRKGKRTIVVDGTRYAWMTRGTDGGHILVSIATDEAFVRGQRGQWLRFAVPYDSLRVAHEGSVSLHQRAAIGPGIARRAIELAKRCSPPFTGRAGEADVVLSEREVEALLFETARTRLAGDLQRALERLAEMRGVAVSARSVGGAEVVLGHLYAVGQLVERSPDADSPPLLDPWVQTHAALLRDFTGHAQACARSIEATLSKSWPAWQRHWPRVCKRRSALAFFVDLCQRAGLEDVAESVDMRALDAALRRVEVEDGARDDKPPGIPGSHWWWRI